MRSTLTFFTPPLFFFFLFPFLFSCFPLFAKKKKKDNFLFYPSCDLSFQSNTQHQVGPSCLGKEEQVPVWLQ
ncbi:hypothetical protein LX36DRAFT_664228 [Colletotrichum falcatum]|nr:hypothetical protein LX36DRAFT_664228 [Colletotrichum falcatum]